MVKKRRLSSRLLELLALGIGSVGTACGQAPKGITPPVAAAQGQAAPMQATPMQATPAQAPRIPPYRISRQDEDYRSLRDPKKRRDLWDAVKYIPLNRSGETYLSFGGEQRDRFEYFEHRTWGLQPQQPGYLLQRTLAHADYHAGARFRLFGQLESSIIAGNRNPPSPIDEDQLDTVQLFADYMPLHSKQSDVTVRIGRQDLFFGSGRLVDVREAPNVRLSFDGVRVWYTHAGWRFDGFLARPVAIGRRDFDDRTDYGINFWGLYGTGPWHALPSGNVDLYYFGYERNNAHFDKGTAHEERETFGTRLWGQPGRWDYNWEGFVQGGRFGSGCISAWYASAVTGYTFKKTPAAPRAGLRLDAISGDRDPGSKNLNTANPLFPTGRYVNEAQLGAQTNLLSVSPFFGLNLSPKINLVTGYDAQWRESLHDGIYSNAIGLIVSGRKSPAPYIGGQAFTQVNVQFDRHLSLGLAYLHYFPGEFLKQSSPGKNVDYVATTLDYKF